MRQELLDLQIAMQQQQAVLMKQQAQVTDAATRAPTAVQERAEMARFAARLAARADAGDIIDSKAPGQLFKYTGKKVSDSAEWDHNVRIFMGAFFGQEIFEAMSWAERQKKPIVKVVPTFGSFRFNTYGDVCGEDADDAD